MTDDLKQAQPAAEDAAAATEAEAAAETAARPAAAKGHKVLRLLLILLIVLVLAGSAFCVWYFAIRDRGYDRYQFDTDAMAGRIQMMTEEEIEAELNRVIEEGMFNISIASAIVFQAPDYRGQARIENIEANLYNMQVDIYLADTGEKIYSSKLIQPGYSIEYITLNRKLVPGVYEATAIFSAITREELQLFGQAGAQIRLYVMDEGGHVPTSVPAATPAKQ